MNKIYFFIAVIVLLSLTFGCSDAENKPNERETIGNWLMLTYADLSEGTHHQKHHDKFKKYAVGFNDKILVGIDEVQASAIDGGGYFVGIKANPPESPIGYNLKLFQQELVNLERKTSYCSGASYSAFMEGLNSIYEKSEINLDENIFEAFRMQEPDGSRREDGVKFWGKWNDDGFGNHFALVQYSGMGKVVLPEDARSGDFMNILWKSGVGHSVVFLGWYLDKNDSLNVVYWSSQKGTNGLGDDIVPVSRIKEVMIVRLTDPDKIYSFDVNTKVNRNIKGYKINFPSAEEHKQ